MGLGNVRLGKFRFCDDGYGRILPHFLQAVLELMGLMLILALPSLDSVIQSPAYLWR